MVGLVFAFSHATISFSAEFIHANQFAFAVKSQNGAGLGSEKPAILSITTFPPWWQKWGPTLLWIILMGLLLWLAYVHFSLRRHLFQTVVRNKQEIQNLKYVNDLKSRFFDYISHEFRTPLSLIIGPVNELQQLIKHKGAEKKLDLIKSNAEVLLQLVDQILELSKIDAKSLRLRLAFGNLALYVKNIVTLFSSLADNKQITLHFEAQPDSISTFFDAEMITKIVSNLLSNAIKFTMPGGGIKVSLSVESASAIETRPTNNIKLVVSDNGIGIPTGDLPHIFDRFVHAYKSVKRPGEGIGLGLCMVKELVQIHQGDIAVESIEGKGTTFTIQLADLYSHFKAGSDLNLLSCLTEDEAKLAALPVKTIHQKEVTGTITQQPLLISEMRKTILLIEDDDKLRAYLIDLLTTEFSVVETNDGESGMRKAIEIKPNLILCDLKLPDKSGFEITTALKADARTSHIPIIVLTARADDSSKLKALQIGADDYITKPFKPDMLLGRISSLILQRNRLKKTFATSLNLEASELTAKSADQQFLEKVRYTIEKSIADERFNVEKLAMAVGLSSSQLSRKLNRILAKPAVQVIQSVRLQRAAQLLKSNCCSISETAYRVGFSNPSYFAKVFHKEFNCTPQEFARKHAVKQNPSII
ncbi:response regulator [candidate division KSB1 bacterium]|nr:response regulator [candidate division KSB1 bacterium]